MELQEFQAKALLGRYSVAVPEGFVARTPDEAEAAAARLGPGRLFVKAQIAAGDRLGAGGIREAGSPAEARSAADELMGRTLATPQTGPEGSMVEAVLVERAAEVERELYLGMGVDPVAAAITLTAGAGGGSGIEERVAEEAAGLKTVMLGIGGERREGEIAGLGRDIGLPDAAVEPFCGFVGRLHHAFVDLDAGFIEINPLVLTPGGEFVAADAKLAMDDNATFRHADLPEEQAEARTDPTELQAQRHQINYVRMDGDVGVVVNGAGLGLATLDMIHMAGGAPANFMDIRTTAKSLDIAHGVGLVLDNPRAKVLLLNVFGGGMQPCDTIVEGLGIAYRRHRRKLPIVMRVTGNNEDFARQRLASFNLPTTECADMWQAVSGAVSAAARRA